MNKNVLSYGSIEDVPQKLALKAGRLNLFYEKGFLRYIKTGDHEVLRLINHAVRDHNWGTVPLQIFDERIVKRENSFTIYYQAKAEQNDIRFLWECTIEGKEDSTITFNIVGEALTRFKRNRIGFTVLHPIKECEGKEILVRNPEGKTEIQKFPELISPEQPFLNIQSMEWELEDGKALLEFSGDIFETEDQRNWTDASYKTYCTPLGLPFPVELKIGDQVEQTIKLSLLNVPEPVSDSDKTELSFSIKQKAFSLPKINIGRSSEIETLSVGEIKKIKKISFDALQIDLKLYEPDWKENLKNAIKESNQLGFPLEISLFFDVVEKEIELLAKAIQKEDIHVATVNIFNKKPHVTQRITVDSVLKIIRKLFPKAKIGMGTNAFFAELNRDRIVMNEIDHLVYSINSQVHAIDNDSLVETIAAQPYTVRTAKSFSKEKPVHISPITFKMRWNPNATGETITNPKQLPPDVDVRQMSLFGASWVLGTVNSFLTSEPASLTFFETVGLKGIMQSEDPLYKDQFIAPVGFVYPMYFIFKILLEHKDWNFYPLETEHSLRFTGLAFGEKGKKASIVLIANYSSDPISVKIPSEFKTSKTGRITGMNISKLMKNPDRFDNLKFENIKDKLDMEPFAIATIRSPGEL